MKRLSVLLLAVVLLLCGCKAERIIPQRQFIKANWSSDVEYPNKLLFRTKSEADEYCELLMPKDDPESDPHTSYNNALVTALEKYDINYYKDNILVVVTIQASSSGDRFSLSHVTKSKDQLAINIQQIESGWTCDMAAWHILIELDNSYDTALENIELNLP